MKPEDLAGAPPARLPFAVTRAAAAPVEAVAEGDGMPTMVGHFATFNDWYEVNSMLEGHFLESIDPAAFNQTIAANRSSMKVLYDHGQDPQIGNKVLGNIESLETDSEGPAYRVPLFDTSYNRDLAPGLKEGAYGSSFRFTVEEDAWNRRAKASDFNPEALPERTITRANVMEFGPVTFPANPNASAGLRSTTDTYYRRSRDPEQFESLLRSAQVARQPSAPPSVAVPPKPQENTVSEPIEYRTREDKAARVSELKSEISALAVEFPGVLPDDAQARWNNMTNETEQLNRDIVAWDARVAWMDAHNDDATVTEPGSYIPAKVNQINRKADRELHSPESKAVTVEGRMREYRDDALRITETTRFPQVADEQRSRDRIDYLLSIDSRDGEMARRVKYTSDEPYLRAFDKIMKAGGQTYGLTQEELRGTALAVGVDGTGGFTVPFAFDPTVIAIGSHSGAINPYRRSCRVVSIVGTDTWNALTSTAVVATRTTEAAPATEQGPTFAQPQYIVTRVQGQITASFEMFQDRADLGAEMAALIQEAKDNEEESSMATGATAAANIGVGPVSGTSGAYTAVAGAGSGVLAALDFVATEAALPVRHRFNAQWFSNRSNIRKAQAVETTGGQLFGGNQYPAVGNVLSERSGNTGLTLLGYPVNESPSLPTATTTTITAMTLLNTDSYVIVDRIGMSVQFIPFIFNSSALATGQQALYFLYRNTAKPINVDAGRTLRYL